MCLSAAPAHSWSTLTVLPSSWCCRAWTMATRRSPVYLATSSTDYSLWWTLLHDLFALHGSTSTSPRYSVTFTGCGCQSGYSLNSLFSSFDVCMVRLGRTWRVSYVVWRTWIQERGCDLRRRLPLSHRLRVVRWLVTAHSSSLRRMPGTLCYPASLRLRHSAPSSVVWKRIFLPRHSLNCFKLRTSDFVLFSDFEKCSWSNH